MQNPGLTNVDIVTINRIYPNRELVRLSNTGSFTVVQLSGWGYTEAEQFDQTRLKIGFSGLVDPNSIIHKVPTIGDQNLLLIGDNRASWGCLGDSGGKNLCN